MTKPFGYQIKDNALIGVVFILAGIVGSFAGAIVIDKHRKFKHSVIVIGLFGLIFYGLLMLTLPTPDHNMALVVINFGLIGLFVVPILPISFAFAVELTYPIPEPMSNGMMLLLSKIYGAILGVVAGMLSAESTYLALSLFLMNALLSMVFSFFVKEDLRRLNMKS